MGTAMKNVFRISAYLCISLIIAHIFLFKIVENGLRSKYKIKTKADARIYYNAGYLIDNKEEQINIINSYRGMLSAAILDKTSKSYIREIPLNYNAEGVSGCRFYMFDCDEDGLSEIYFDHPRNDSLFLCSVNPAEKIVKEIFLHKRSPIKGVKGNNNSIHISDIVPIQIADTGKKVLAVAVSTAWGSPRVLSIVDPHSGKILKEKNFPTSIRQILYSNGVYYLNLYAYYNGVECDGRKDTFA